MIPVALLQIAPFVAEMRIVVAQLPNGDVERSRFTETGGGVLAFVERQPSRSDIATRRQVTIPRGKYDWKIVEERRTVIMAAPGKPTGTVRRAFGLIMSIDRRPRGSVTPNPIEAYRFYAPTRESAEELRDRLKSELNDER